MDEVYDDDDRRQDAETDQQRYAGVHPDVDSCLCIYTYTQHIDAVHRVHCTAEKRLNAIDLTS